MPAPAISVIVLSKNPGRAIQATLDSIWSQTVPKEIVVIDGASTDGTADWLAANATRLTRFVSEPDRGVYDAMNKGVNLATGDWVLFLGTDDRLATPSVFAEAQQTLTQTSASIVCGEARYDDGRIYNLPPSVNPLARNFGHHQATFYRRSLFEQLGMFLPGFVVMGDYDFNLRLWKAGLRFKSISLRVAECASGGLSDAGRWVGYREEIAVRHRYATASECWLWDIASVIRFLRKKIVRRFRKQKRSRL